MNIKKLRELKKNKKGFTLIEIIVVIVILAVLMAVAVPSVLNYLNEADNAKYMAQARTVLTTAQAETVKAYVGDSKISTTEWNAMIKDADPYGTINKAIGTGTKELATKITLYTGTAVVTQAGDVITVTGGTAISTTADYESKPDIKVITFNLDGKGIAIELNGKVYISNTPFA